MPETITYQLEPELTADEFIDVLHRSTLAQRRPVDQKIVIEGMLRNANVIVAARNDQKILVGVSRAISDFHFCTYLSDLAVDVAYQRMGIGKQLIEETHRAASETTRLILLSAPDAVNYYPHIGMVPHNSCWQILPNEPLHLWSARD